MGILSPSSPGSDGSEREGGRGGRIMRVFSRKKKSADPTASKPSKNSSAPTTTSGKTREATTTSRFSKLKNAFDFFDIDNDGRISSDELCKVLKFLGTRVSEEEARLMIAEVDANSNETVEFNEFLEMMSRYQRISRQQICAEASSAVDADVLETFQAFDHNGDNYIDFSELKKTMQFLGESVSDDDIRCMMRQADKDGDGRIDLEEFKSLMTAIRVGAGCR